MADLQGSSSSLQVLRAKYKRSQLSTQLDGYNLRCAEIKEELSKVENAAINVKAAIEEIDREITQLSS